MVTVVGANPADPLAPLQWYRLSLAGNFFAGGGAPALLWDQLAGIHLVPVSPRPPEGGVFDSSGSAVPGFDAASAVIDVRTEQGIAGGTVADLADRVGALSLTLSVTRIQKIAQQDAGNPSELNKQLTDDQSKDPFKSLTDSLGKAAKWIILVLILVAVIVVLPKLFRRGAG